MTEEELFAAALEQPTPEGRAAFLAAACGDDAALRQRVEALLESHEHGGGFLKTPAIQLAAGVSPGAEGHTELNPKAENHRDDLSFLAPSQQPGSLGRLGHYEVQEVIGRGGMGIVLRAVDEKLHRVAAIKVMAAQLATNATARKRFTREAQAAAAVTHDHIVTIYAVDEAAGLPYLAMQFVAGLSLQERIDRTGPLQVEEILRIGMQTASGLAAAHAQGLIHRDIKPANILLENGVERVRLTDFGLARAADDANLTQSGMVAGTPHYMSPEQAQGTAIDQRSDLFSLGSVLYAMCTGRAPFRASGTVAVLKRVCDETPTPVHQINSAIPAWLAAIIEKLHAKDPADRYQSADEVAEVLGRHLAYVQHPSVMPLPQAVAVTAESVPPRKIDLSRRPASVGTWRTVAAVLLVLLCGGLSLTEATGVTRLVPTVIRIVTGEGTLVVETDPDVQVTMEGNGDLTFQLAGGQSIRVPTGDYRVKATKEGKPIPLDKELVSIARGGNQVVRVRLERAPQIAAAPQTEPGAFVLLAADKERKFDTLAEAVQTASDGDTIEVRGNGPFITDPIKITGSGLNILAAEGYRPVIKLSDQGVQSYDPLLETSVALTLEGLEFQRLGQKAWKPGQSEPCIIFARGASLGVANCRFRSDSGAANYQVHIVTNAAVSHIRNCLFLTPGETSVGAWGNTLVLDNCLHLGRLTLATNVRGAGNGGDFRLRRNTVVSPNAHGINLAHFPEVKSRRPAEVPNPLKLEATENVFNVSHVLHFGSDTEQALDPKESESSLVRVLTWKGRDNVYQVPAHFVLWTWPREGQAQSAHGPRNVEDWGKFWNSPEPGSVEGAARYQGGDLLARLAAAPEKITPDDFRLRADSAGYRAGPDGKDLGADVDLVGPGPAYDRWKKTPEYQTWLKDTRQQRAEVPQADDRAAVEDDIKKLSERIEKSPDDRSARIARAHLYTRQRQWREAADDLLSAGDAVLDDPADAFLYAILLVHLHESGLHRQFCERMRDRFASTTDVWTANCLVKSCLLQPGIVDPSKLPVSLLSEDREFATNEPQWVLREARALVAYRSGKFAEARRLVRETLALPAYKNDPLYAPRALSILAMATHKSGDAQLARDLYEQARQQFDKNQLAPGHPATICWVYADIFRREAAQELGLEEISLDGAAARELAKWQGEWENPDYGRLVIKGERWSSHPKKGFEVVSTIKIVEVTDEMTHVLLLNAGIDGKVRTIQTILRVDGDTLHNCGTIGSVRPAEFANKPGFIYTQWTRVAKPPP